MLWIPKFDTWNDRGALGPRVLSVTNKFWYFEIFGNVLNYYFIYISTFTRWKYIKFNTLPNKIKTLTFETLIKRPTILNTHFALFKFKTNSGVLKIQNKKTATISQPLRKSKGFGMGLERKLAKWAVLGLSGYRNHHRLHLLHPPTRW